VCSVRDAADDVDAVVFAAGGSVVGAVVVVVRVVGSALGRGYSFEM